MHDAEQAPLVERYVSTRDWEFIADESVPRMEERAGHLEWMRGALDPKQPIAPEMWMMACWNVMGVLPLTEGHGRLEEERADDREMGWWVM